MNVLITAGPTRERLDPVRFLSNRSSGRMGYALAEAAWDAGHAVVLISGPVALPPPAGVETLAVESAAQMADAVRGRKDAADLIIMAAAVADYRPAHPVTEKMKKSPGPLFLELERTEDILALLGKTRRPGQILVGFAAETQDLERYAGEKLIRKNLDWIAANYVADGFETTTDALILLHRDGGRFVLPKASKAELARQLLARILSTGK